MSRPTIKQGAKGSDVLVLQQLLNGHGHTVAEDADFGPNTTSAVKQFQASRNLGVDGIVGPNTWSALEADSSSREQDIGDDAAVVSEKDKLLAKIPTGIGAQRTAALTFAISFLGADEIPDGSNWGPEIQPVVEGYNEYWGVSTAQYGRMAWCAMFCSTCIGVGVGAGTKSTDMDWKATPIKKFLGGASQYEDWGHANSKWVEETEAAPAGSVFSMARGGSNSDPAQTAKAGHVGMIVCDNDNGTVTTIEGNVSNGCRSYTRKKSDLHGFIPWR